MTNYRKFFLVVPLTLFAPQINAQALCDQLGVEEIRPSDVANAGACSFGGISAVELNLVKFGLCKDVPSTNGVTVNLSSCITIAKNKKITVTLNESGIEPDAEVEGKTDAESNGAGIPTASYSAVFLIIDNVIKHKGTVKFIGGVNNAAGSPVDPNRAGLTYCSTNGIKTLDNGITTFVWSNGNWIDAQTPSGYGSDPPLNPIYVGADCSVSQPEEKYNEMEFISASGVNYFTDPVLPLDVYTLREDNVTLSTPTQSQSETSSNMKRILLVSRLSPSLQISNTSELLLRTNFSLLGSLDVRLFNTNYYLVTIDIKRGFTFEPSLR